MANRGREQITVTRPRLKTCVEAWPECHEGGYDPRCCRFPKSCSCDVYDDNRVTAKALESESTAAMTTEQRDELFGVLWLSLYLLQQEYEYRRDTLLGDHAYETLGSALERVDQLRRDGWR